MDDFLILQRKLEQMVEVMNATVGVDFRIPFSDTLFIIERRMKESDLSRAIKDYNGIFSCSNGCDITSIQASVIAYIKIKILVEANSYDFDAVLRRLLYKEYGIYETKLGNIMHLTKVNARTASFYEKEMIEAAIAKNEAVLDAIKAEKAKLETIIEKEGALEEEHVVDEPKEEIPTEVTEKTSALSGGIHKMSEVISNRKKQKDNETFLREKEKESSQTLCKEISYYEKSLSFDVAYFCKDMKAYSLMRKKNALFFGLSKNITGKTYDNLDQSLLELTEASEDFIQYMTEDLLGGDFDLKPFTKDEKKALRMYFSFVTNCFENEIGHMLTVSEYLEFKTYYNQIVLCMFEMDEAFRKDYYKALVLADNYISYMSCYDLEVSDSKKQIVNNIISERNSNYISDLEMIIKNHVVDRKARETIDRLIDKIKRFSSFEEVSKKDESVAKESIQSMRMSGKIDPTPESLDPAIHFRADEYNDETSIGMDDFRAIQIKIQFLNSDYVIVDEALFATSNIRKAVYDYLRRGAYIKKIGLYVNEKEIFLYSSKNGSLSIAVLDDEIRKAKRLDEGVQGQLVRFYEEEIRKEMIKQTS